MFKFFWMPPPKNWISNIVKGSSRWQYKRLNKCFERGWEVWPFAMKSLNKKKILCLSTCLSITGPPQHLFCLYFSQHLPVSVSWQTHFFSPPKIFIQLFVFSPCFFLCGTVLYMHCNLERTCKHNMESDDHTVEGFHSAGVCYILPLIHLFLRERTIDYCLSNTSDFTWYSKAILYIIYFEVIHLKNSNCSHEVIILKYIVFCCVPPSNNQVFPAYMPIEIIIYSIAESWLSLKYLIISIYFFLKSTKSERSKSYPSCYIRWVYCYHWS